MIQKAGQPPQPWIGINLYVRWHLVVYKGVILMTDDAPRIGHLRNVAGTVAAVWPAPMPGLIVNQRQN